MMSYQSSNITDNQHIVSSTSSFEAVRNAGLNIYSTVTNEGKLETDIYRFWEPQVEVQVKNCWVAATRLSCNVKLERGARRPQAASCFKFAALEISLK
jgi:hypothetical protein